MALEALAHPDAQQEDAGRGRALYAAGYHCLRDRPLRGGVRAGAVQRTDRARVRRPARAGGQALYIIGNRGHCASAVRADAREHFAEGLALARQPWRRARVDRRHVVRPGRALIRNRASSSSPSPRTWKRSRYSDRRPTGPLARARTTSPAMRSPFAPRPRPCTSCAKRWRQAEAADLDPPSMPS